MAERDQADRFDALVDEVLSLPGRAAIPASAERAEVWRLAADLADLPAEGFRTRLASELERRARLMTQITAVPYVPAGFRTLTPYVIVKGADRFITFVKEVFGAEEVFRAADPDGSIRHAEVRIGDSMVEVSDGGEAWPARPVALHVYVPDADAAWARAEAAGARTLIAPTDMPYGDREADVTDPFGNNWYIGSRTAGGPVPAGMNTVTPTLHVKGTDRLIDFIRQAFGAEELDRTLAADGTVMHAQLRLGDSVLELGEARGFLAPMPGALHYYVPDVDAVYARALAAGATTLGAPSDRPYGDRSAEVGDPFGNHWFIATRIADTRYR
jgi:uncharacterized glyoxalase superfamily protein PhnB